MGVEACVWGWGRGGGGVKNSSVSAAGIMNQDGLMVDPVSLSESLALLAATCSLH